MNLTMPLVSSYSAILPTAAILLRSRQTTTTYRSSRRTQRGWSLVESCAALAVASILAGSAASSYSDLMTRKRLELGSQQLVADLGYLRSEVVSRNEGLRISFGQDSAGSCYVLHSGSVGDCECNASGQAACPSSDSRIIKSVALPSQNGITIAANVSSIHFDPRLGISSPAGTLRLIDKQGRSIHHVVSVRGRVRVCSQGSLLSTLPSC